MLHPNAALPVNVKRGNTKCRLSRFPIYKPLVRKSYTGLAKTNVRMDETLTSQRGLSGHLNMPQKRMMAGTMDSKNMARHLIEITEEKNMDNIAQIQNHSSYFP